MAKKLIAEQPPVTELFSAEDMLKFASRYTDFEPTMDELRDFVKQRNRERAIQEFIKEYDKKHE